MGENIATVLRLPPAVLATIGIIGLTMDVFFHWGAACYGDGNCDPVSVVSTLLVDVDPATVPIWLTILGVVAHVLFIGGFLLLVLMAWIGRKSKADSERSGRSELARIEDLIRVQIERDGRSWVPLPPAMVSGDSDVRKNG